MLRLEHASVLTAADIERFGRLGITAVIQPAFLASETEWLETRVGQRTDGPYLCLPRTARRRGCHWQDPPTAPWSLPIRCGGWPPPGTGADSLPTRDSARHEALDLFTGGAATAIGETRIVVPGGAADLVVLDREPAPGTAGRSAGMRRSTPPMSPGRPWCSLRYRPGRVEPGTVRELAEPFPDRSGHVLVLGVGAGLLLGVDEVAVDGDLIDPAGRRDERDRLDLHQVFVEQLLCHAHGTAEIASTAAVLDFDAHGGTLSGDQPALHATGHGDHLPGLVA